MEYRRLGRSGLKVPELSFGTGTFGGRGQIYSAWGNADEAGGRRMVDICLEHGANMFDSASNYSEGLSEKILGAAIKGRRDKVLLSTKATLRAGDGPNDIGSSRIHLTKAVEESLKRLGTDYIDLFIMHACDRFTPVEETLQTLDMLVRQGKVLYVGASNFSGWSLAKSLMVSHYNGWPRYVAHQGYYSLIGREYETEHLPLALDEGVGTIVWSPLGWGRLTGRITRSSGLPKISRLHETEAKAPPVSDELFFRVVDVLQELSEEVGRSVPQIAINWLLRRPTVASVVMGARTEEQLRDNLGSIGWALTDEQVRRLDDASAFQPGYPYWHQWRNPELNPPLV